MALGSSAIVKVSGQNSFWALYGSLRQICLGLPKGSAEGSTKVSTSFVVSRVLWGRSVLGCPEVHLGLPKGSVEGSNKVSPRFHQGFTKLAQVS